MRAFMCPPGSPGPWRSMSCGQRCLAVTGDMRPQLRLHRFHFDSACRAVPGCAVAAGALCQPLAVSQPYSKHPGTSLGHTQTHKYTHTEGNPTAARCELKHTHSAVHRSPYLHTHLQGSSGRPGTGQALGPLQGSRVPLCVPKCHYPEIRSGQRRCSTMDSARATRWGPGVRIGDVLTGIGGCP